MQAEDVALTYQALGEFVILFQWVENLYRQIGWFILDPDRKQWPPLALRRERNRELIDKVTNLYVDLTRRYAFPSGNEKAADMLELKEHFHNLRRFRNRLLHSTYIELKAGGDVLGYVRSNPNVGVDEETGELIFDQKPFSATEIQAKVREYGEYILRLNFAHVQLIHWSPFEQYGPQ